jgi:hypothetical protein
VTDSAFTLCPILRSTDYRLLTSGFFDLGLRLAKREGEFVLRTPTFRAGSQFQLQIPFFLNSKSAIRNSKFPLYALCPMRIDLAKGEQMG